MINYLLERVDCIYIGIASENVMYNSFFYIDIFLDQIIK